MYLKKFLFIGIKSTGRKATSGNKLGKDGGNGQNSEKATSGTSSVVKEKRPERRNRNS